MNKELIVMINQVEAKLSPERKEYLDQVGEDVRQFVFGFSKKELRSFFESLDQEQRITFIAVGLRACYQSLRKLKGEVA